MAKKKKKGEENSPVEEIKQAGKERFLAPFYLSLMVSFAVWNWRAIFYVLFPDSSLGLEDRLTAIDTKLYPDFWWDHAIKLIIAPLVSAMVAVAGIPWLALWLDGPRYRASVELYNEHKKQDLKREEQQKIIKDLHSTIGEKESLLRQKSDEIGKQQQKINTLEGDFQTNRDNLLRGLIPVLSELDIPKSIIAEVHSNGGVDVPAKEINRMVTMKLIEPVGIKRYKLTREGERLLFLWN